MQQAEKAAAEPEAKRRRSFRLEGEGRVIQRQFFQRLAKAGEIIRVDRKQPAEHHRHRRFEPRQRFGARTAFLGDGIPHTGVRHRLHAGIDKADLAGAKFINRRRFRREHADTFDNMCRAGAHHADLHALADAAMPHPDKRHHAEIGVIPAIDQQRHQRCLDIALGRRHTGDNSLEDIANANAGLGTCRDGIIGGQADHILDLRLHPLRLGRRQVNLVQDRHDFMVGLDRLIDIGQRLRLDPLAGIDHQQRSLAGRQRARHLIAEIDMPRRVHQIQDIILAIGGGVVQPHCLRLDGDPALALNIHIVENLLGHLALAKTAANLNQPVGDGRLAMVDMRDNREITDMAWRGHRWS